MNKCELCKSQWGNFWKSIKNQHLFFCCHLCALQYENLITAIQNQFGSREMSITEIQGTSRLRICKVVKNNKEYRFSASYSADGQIFRFKEL